MIKIAQDRSVSQLFDNDSRVVYFVPRYQREYTWKEPQWEHLFYDILENEEEYFLGSIIIINHNSGSGSSDEVRRLEVVDGQQRIVTLSLLYAAIYSELNKCELDKFQSAELVGLIWRLILKKHHKNIADPIRVIPQDFSLNKNNDLKVYKAVLAKAGLAEAGFLKLPAIGLSSAEEGLIPKAYQYFQKKVSTLSDTDGEQKIAIIRLLNKVNNAKLVEIDVESQADAYTLFESLNNRGIALSGVDIIKSKLLARLDKLGHGSIENYSNNWEELLNCLGDDYAVQERFFRQYYNAFKKTIPGAPVVPVATKSNLISIYEDIIKHSAEDFIDKIMAAGDLYSFIICRAENKNKDFPTLAKHLQDLERIQGTPSYLLLLYLLSNMDRIGLSEGHLSDVTQQLVRFFVRRNLTNVPPTNALTRLFMDIVREVADLTGEDAVKMINHKLASESSDEETFKKSLSGPVYSENTNAVRFILCSLEENKSGNQKWDLWRMYKKHYVWTIEHIFPQGRNIPATWIEMIASGDEAKAKELQKLHVNRIGNLTITGYNSNLGTRSFTEKMDRKDKDGHDVGYRNHLYLNEYVVKCPNWTVDQIEERTEILVEEVLKLFPLKKNTDTNEDKVIKKAKVTN
jgi:hypothetical protein